MGTSIRHTAIYQRRRGVNLAAAAVGLGAAYAWLGDTLPAVGQPTGDWVDVVGGLSAAQTGAPLVGTLNGRKAPLFTGTQWFQTTPFADMNQPFSVVAVTAASSITGSVFAVCGLRGAANVGIERVGAAWRILAQTALPTGDIIAANVPVVIRGVFNGAASELWINGSLVASGDAGTTGIDVVTIGARSGFITPWLGTIGALVIFPAATIANAATFAALAQQAYGITP